jgi:hypothetical protein
VLGAEWLVRRWGPERLRLTPARSAIVHSSRYGWQLRASWRSRDENGRAVSTDASRRRVPVRADGGGGTLRVAVLGASVAFGPGVDDHETFANLMARQGWAVANFAVPGWGTDQSLLRYQHEGRAWTPAVVVLNVCVANDLADNMLASYLYDASWPKPYFTIEDGRLRVHDEHLVRSTARRAWRWLWESSHLLNLLVARPQAAAPDERHWMGRRRVAVKDDAAATALTVMEVRALRDAAREQGAALLVALHPDRATFEGRSPVAVRLGRGLEDASVPVLDLAARYRAAGWAFDDLMLDGLGHLSPRGHAVAAEVIARAIRSRRPPAPGTS